MSDANPDLDALVGQKYRHGFVTDIESDTVPPGLDEDVDPLHLAPRRASRSSCSTGGCRRYRHWLTHARARTGRKLHYPPIDYQAISYYSAPKSKTDGPKSLDEVDPKLLATYEKLGVPLHERARLAGVAVDAVFDSVSVATTFKEQAGRRPASIFCPFSEAVQRAPGTRRAIPRQRRALHATTSSPR